MQTAVHHGISISAAVLLGLFVLSSTAHAQSGPFPNRAVKIVVPATPGGNNDLIARALAPKISEGLGQPVLLIFPKFATANWVHSHPLLPGEGWGEGLSVPICHLL